MTAVTDTNRDDTADVSPLDVRFDPPGPGSWSLDRDHQSAPRSSLFDALFIEGFESGFRHAFARYGLPLETMQARSVNGWLYMRAKVAGAPDRGGPPPPDIVLKILSRVVPELRRRNKAAKAAIDERMWADDVATWKAERSGWMRASHELLDVDLAGLDDEQLAAHVRAAVDHARRMVTRHFELVGVSVAVGRLLVAAGRWGIDPTEAGLLLAGGSPESSAPAESLRAMAELVAAAGSTPRTVDDLRQISPELASKVDDYIHEHGWRTLSDDPEQPTLAEHGEHLVSMILGARGGATTYDVDGLRTRLRTQVPADDRAEFDRTVDEARSAYGCLDDNSGVTSLALGVARRAIVEVARRASGDGRATSADHVWNTTLEELYELADGRQGPGSSELERRAARRAEIALVDPPEVVGDLPSPPPDAALFPAPMAAMVAGFGAYVGNKFGSPGGQATRDMSLRIDGEVVATGHAVGTGGASGRIVVAAEVADALDRLEPGDILAGPLTTPAWNSVFPMLGGIVTETGGPMSHAAVLAREFDLPAVIGVGPTDPSWDGRDGVIGSATV